MAVDTPAGHIYTGNGNTRVFPIPTRIIGDDYVRIELDGVYLSDRTQWDIVNNSIIFITAPANGVVVNIKVATSEEALAVLGSSTNVDIVATNMTDVNTVANNINNIDTVATNINNVNIVAGNISKVNTVATNIVGINQIVDNLHEILSADESATTATTKASEASASATSASTSATNASTSASQALTSRNQAETFKNSASTSATTATTKASEASASATTATTKASEASASATNASTSASQALTSRNQAETFAQQAQASASSVDANNIVHRSGDESIGGVKTFSSSPIVPTPTTGTQAVNKDYADLKVALTQFTGTNQSISNNGYQKIPGGLIIQWGLAPYTVQGASGTKIFPISFPNYCISVSLTDYAALTSLSVIWAVNNISTDNFSYHFSIGSSGMGTAYQRVPFYIAIGY